MAPAVHISQPIYSVIWMLSARAGRQWLLAAIRSSPVSFLSCTQGDALDPGQPWREQLKGALGVVSTLGAFGSNDYMYKVPGEVGGDGV